MYYFMKDEILLINEYGFLNFSSRKVQQSVERVMPIYDKSSLLDSKSNIMTLLYYAVDVDNTHSSYCMFELHSTTDNHRLIHIRFSFCHVYMFFKIVLGNLPFYFPPYNRAYLLVFILLPHVCLCKLYKNLYI